MGFIAYIRDIIVSGKIMGRCIKMKWTHRVIYNTIKCVLDENIVLWCQIYISFQINNSKCIGILWYFMLITLQIDKNVFIFVFIAAGAASIFRPYLTSLGIHIIKIR